MGLKEQLAVASLQMKGFEIPSLPKEVIEIQSIFKKTEFPDMSEIASIIKKNTILSGELIKVANQKEFRGSRSEDVRTVKSAVDAMGQDKLKKLIFAIAFRAQVKGEVFDDLMMHTIAVGNVCAELSQYLAGIDAEDAYLTGLFHNAGAIIMAMKFPDYAKVFYNTISNAYSGISRETNLYKANHGVYGLLVSRKWGLNKRYAEVILLHHQKELSIVKDAEVRTLIVLVQLASTIVSEALFNSYLGEEVAQMKKKAMVDLMIDDETVGEIRRALMTDNLV